eukprot:9597-Heterococcus_DN1.PRE.1
MTAATRLSELHRPPLAVITAKQTCLLCMYHCCGVIVQDVGTRCSKSCSVAEQACAVAFFTTDCTSV